MHIQLMLQVKKYSINKITLSLLYMPQQPFTYNEFSV